MDFLDTDITNPFFYGYMNEAEFDSALSRIKSRRGTSMSASDLARELEREGYSPRSLSRAQLRKVDDAFDVWD